MPTRIEPLAPELDEFAVVDRRARPAHPDGLHADRRALERAGEAEHAALLVDQPEPGSKNVSAMCLPAAGHPAPARRVRSRTVRRAGGSGIARSVVRARLLGEPAQRYLRNARWCCRPAPCRRSGRSGSRPRCNRCSATERMVSPHTGHGSPARPWTRPGGPSTSSCRGGCARRPSPRRPPSWIASTTAGPRQPELAGHGERRELGPVADLVGQHRARGRRSCAGRAGTRGGACCRLANSAASVSA